MFRIRFNQNQNWIDSIVEYLSLVQGHSLSMNCSFSQNILKCQRLITYVYSILLLFCPEHKHC